MLVLAKGVGATHLAPGTIDVLGYAPERVERPREALARLAERPTIRTRCVGARRRRARRSTGSRRGRGGSLAPTPTRAALDENLLLPTAVGAPQAVGGRAGDDGRRRPARRRRRCCVVGFRALKDFHAALLADNLRARRASRRARVELDLAPERPRRRQRARLRARVRRRRRSAATVVAQLGRAAAAPTSASAFPAVLGHRATRTRSGRELEHRARAAGVRGPDAAAVGARACACSRSCASALRRAGGRVILNTVVVGAERDGRRA